MIHPPKQAARISEHTRSLITDYYKLSNDKGQTKNILAAAVGRRSPSPTSPTSSTRQNTVISDIKDHQSLGSLDSEEQQLSIDDLQKLLRDPKVSKKEKEYISKALLEGNMSYYYEFLNTRSLNSRTGSRTKPVSESSDGLLKEIRRDQTHLLQMRHRLPKPNFLTIAPESMAIPVRSGRDVREEKLQLMRRGLTTAGHDPSMSLFSMGAVAQRHRQLEQIQQMNFQPEEVNYHPEMFADASFAQNQNSMESITLIQSEQVHHIGNTKSSTYKSQIPMSDDWGNASVGFEMHAGGDELEMDLHGDLADNSTIELSQHDGGDDISVAPLINQKAASSIAGQYNDVMLTGVPGQDQQQGKNSGAGVAHVSEVNRRQERAAAGEDREFQSRPVLDLQSPVVHPTPPHLRRGLTSVGVHPQPSSNLQSPNPLMLSKNMVVKNANPRELYSKLARQDKQKRIAKLKLQLQAEKEYIADLKRHARESIEKKVGLKKQLDGFRQQLKEYLDKNKHPLRGAILRCVDDSMIYHLLQRYNGFSLTPEAILMLLGNSLGTSILVDPSAQHERETGLPNNNIISEHPEFMAWKAEEKAAHEYIVMERLAPLMEAVTAEGILPPQALVSDFNSTMNINNYQHFGQRHPYRLPALMHVKKHEDPRDKIERIQLDPNPFRDHDRGNLSMPYTDNVRPTSSYKLHVRLRPASPPGSVPSSPVRGSSPPRVWSSAPARPWTTDNHLMHAADGTLHMVQSLAVSSKHTYQPFAPGTTTATTTTTAAAAANSMDHLPASPTVGAGFRMMQATGRLSPLGLHERSSPTYAQDDMFMHVRRPSPSQPFSLAHLVRGVREDMLPKSMRPDLLQQQFSHSQSQSRHLGGKLLELDDEYPSQRRHRKRPSRGNGENGDGDVDDDDDDVSSLGDDRSAVLTAAAARVPPAPREQMPRDTRAAVTPSRTLGRGGLLISTSTGSPKHDGGRNHHHHHHHQQEKEEEEFEQPRNAGLGFKAQTAISIMHESLVEEGILYVEPDVVLSEEQIVALGKHERSADAVISQVIRLQKFKEEEEMRQRLAKERESGGGGGMPPVLPLSKDQQRVFMIISDDSEDREGAEPHRIDLYPSDANAALVMGDAESPVVAGWEPPPPSDGVVSAPSRPSEPAGASELPAPSSSEPLVERSTTLALSESRHEAQDASVEHDPEATGHEVNNAAAAVTAAAAAVDEEMRYLKQLQEEEARYEADQEQMQQQMHQQALLRAESFRSFDPSPQLLQFEAEQMQRPGHLHSATTAFVNSPANPTFVNDAESVGSKSTTDKSDLFKPDLVEMQRQAQQRQMVKTPLLSTPDPKEKIDALIVAMSSHHKRHPLDRANHVSSSPSAEWSRVAPRALKTRELITIYHNRGSHVSRWEQRGDALGPPPSQDVAVAPSHGGDDVDDHHPSTLDPALLMLPVSSNENLRRQHRATDPQNLPAISPYGNYHQEVKVISSGVPAGAGLMLWRPRHVINQRGGHAHVARYPHVAQTSNHAGSGVGVRGGTLRTATTGKLSKPFVSAS
jgi:hypothetical protein